MNKIQKAGIAAAILYAMIGIVAFGHAAASSDRRSHDKIAACKAENGPAKVCTDLNIPMFDGAAAGVLWPLYLSWEFFS